MEYNELKEEGGKFYYYFINNSEKIQPNNLLHSNPEIWENMVLAELDQANKTFKSEIHFIDAFNDVRKFIQGAIGRFKEDYKSKLNSLEYKGLEIEINKLKTAKNSTELLRIMRTVLDLVKDQLPYKS